jgi:hypothetical protein
MAQASSVKRNKVKSDKLCFVTQKPNIPKSVVGWKWNHYNK